MRGSFTHTRNAMTRDRSSNLANNQTKSHDCLKTGRRATQRPLSFALSRSYTRTVIISMLQQREEERKAAKKSVEKERLIVAQSWKAESRQKQVEKLRDLVERLSQKKPICAKAYSFDAFNTASNEQTSKKSFAEVAETTINSRAKTSMQKTLISSQKNRVNEVKQKREAEQQELKQKYDEKLEKAKIAALRVRFARTQSMQFNQGQRRRKLLKSKVINFLAKESGNFCEHYVQNAERLQKAELKDKFRKKPKDLTLRTLQTTQECQHLEPDEVLLSHFGEEELKLVRQRL